MFLYNLFPAFYEENQLTDTNPFKPCKGHIDAERFMKFTGLATAMQPFTMFLAVRPNGCGKWNMFYISTG